MTDLGELAARLKNRTALQLLPRLPLMLDHSDWLRVDQRALGTMLGTSQAGISRAMRALIEVNAVQRTGHGPGVRYRLSRAVEWPMFHNVRSASPMFTTRSAPPPPPWQKACQPPLTAEAAQLALNNARVIAQAAAAELTALLGAPLTPAAALAAATARAEAAEATLQVAKARLLSLRRAERRARKAVAA